MVRDFYFKDRDGQTPLPKELQKGLIPKHVQTVGELDEYEEANIAEGLAWLEGHPHKDFLQYGFWLRLHSKLFSNVWKWAGQIRKHELANTYFSRPHEIWPKIGQLEKDIEYWLQNSTYAEREIIARIHERLLTIHPFANGNGRFSRILVEYISQQLGWRVPTWGKSLKDRPDQRRKEYISALDYARETKKYDQLEKFMYS